MQDFRNLSVWQRARRLTKSVYEMTADFPGSAEFGLKSQMRRAMGSACELECETILSYDLAFITEAAQDAILETPLVPAIFEGRSGILRGHAEIRPFFEEGARRRPNQLVRWYRTGNWLTDGNQTLMWEYPRQAPDGDQIELVEVMEIEHGLIQHHRIYWGWFGVNQLTQNAVRKVTQPS